MILGWIVLAALLALLAVLAAPVEVSVTADSRATPRVSVRIGLLGGVLPAFALTSPTGRKERKKEKRKRAKAGGGVDGKRVACNLPALFAGLLRQIEISRLVLRLRFGLGDPAETGALYGQAMALAAPLNARRGVAVDLAPDFGDKVLAGRGEIAFRATPLAFVPPILRFVWASFGPVR